MVKFTITRADTSHDGSISGYLNKAAFIITNTHLQEQANILTEKFGLMSCPDHPNHDGNSVDIRIPGGDGSKESSGIFKYAEFCCKQFEEEVRRQVQAEYNNRPIVTNE